MLTQDNPLDRQKAVHEVFAQNLGLALVDSEVEILLKGKVLSLEKLLKQHNLTEIGILLIRLDAILRVNQNHQDIPKLSMGKLDKKGIAGSNLVGSSLQVDCPNCKPGCRCEKVLFICIEYCPNKPIDFHLSSDWLG